MTRVARILICSVALAAGSPLGIGSALAQGTTTSAGDQQYVDPLATTTTSTPATTTTSGASTTTPTSTSPTSAPATATSTTPAPAPAARDSGGTLPFTGLNLWTLVIAGAGLVGGGLALRRAARRA